MLILSGNHLGADTSVANITVVQKAINEAAVARGLSERGPVGGFFNEQNYKVVLAISKSVAADQALLARLPDRTKQGFQTIATGKVTFDEFDNRSVEDADGAQDTIKAMQMVARLSDPKLREVPGGTKAWVMAGIGLVVLSFTVWLAGRHD